MSTRLKQVAIPQSELMTKKLRNHVMFPVITASFLIVVAVACGIADFVIPAVIIGGLALLPLILVVRNLFRLISDTRTMMKELSYMADKNEEVINSFSHKIREPLNNLVLLNDMLRETSVSGKLQELFETSKASTDNMVEVVNELTMETAGNITFEPRGEIRYKLGPTIHDTVELFKLNRRHEESLIFYDDRGEGETELSGDPIVIKQILIDLLSTVISACEEKTTIKIQAREAAVRDGNYVLEFTLSTNHPVIFIGEGRQSFTLAGRLINSSGGYWQETSSDTGSVFVFSYPTHKSIKIEKPEAASTLIKGLRKEAKKKELKDLSILLVEDNPINQRITQLMLGPLVRKIEVARNGKEALDMFGTSVYDLILMDVQMPVMNGLIAAEKIRALEMSTQMHIPIIAITANAMLGDKEQCLAVGMDDYISKPIEPQLLIEKISMLI